MAARVDVAASPAELAQLMRLIFTVLGTTVVDLELRWPSRQQADEVQGLQLEASGGGHVELAVVVHDVVYTPPRHRCWAYTVERVVL